MEPWFAQHDVSMFYKYLDKATHYFEFGSGGSTYQACIRENIKSIYSVESDYSWHEIIKQTLQDYSKITFLYNDMKTRENTWGYPGPDSTIDQCKNYSQQIINIPEEKRKEIDVILIDGRFRVACCLKCYDIMNDSCVIIFDDFLDRPHYHIVLDYFEIIEKTVDNKMVILKKKKDKKPPQHLINYYETISD